VYGSTLTAAKIGDTGMIIVVYIEAWLADTWTKSNIKDLLCTEVGRMNFGELQKNPLALFDIMIKKCIIFILVLSDHVPLLE